MRADRQTNKQTYRHVYRHTENFKAAHCNVVNCSTLAGDSV